MRPLPFAPRPCAARIVRAVVSLGALLPCLWAGTAHADGAADWRLHASDEATGTRVWLRPRADGPPEFRGVSTVRARLSSLVAALRDVERMPQWVYRQRSAVDLSTDGDLAGLSRVVFAMPWPLSDREALVRWRLEQDPATLAVTLSGEADPAAAPPDPAFVRMPSFASRWHLTPRAGGAVEVVFEGHGDLGGSLGWGPLRAFAAAAAWEAPLRTLVALHAFVAQPGIADATLPYLREPAQ
jgi:hypothetical protein